MCSNRKEPCAPRTENAACVCGRWARERAIENFCARESQLATTMHRRRRRESNRAAGKHALCCISLVRLLADRPTDLLSCSPSPPPGDARRRTRVTRRLSLAGWMAGSGAAQRAWKRPFNCIRTTALAARERTSSRLRCSVQHSRWSLFLQNEPVTCIRGGIQLRADLRHLS